MFWNYLSVGMDAAAAHGFHQLREAKPWAARGRVTNQAWCELDMPNTTAVCRVSMRTLCSAWRQAGIGRFCLHQARPTAIELLRRTPCDKLNLRRLVLAPCRYTYYGFASGWMTSAPPIRDTVSLQVG